MLLVVNSSSDSSPSSSYARVCEIADGQQPAHIPSYHERYLPCMFPLPDAISTRLLAIPIKPVAGSAMLLAQKAASHVTRVRTAYSYSPQGLIEVAQLSW